MMKTLRRETTVPFVVVAQEEDVEEEEALHATVTLLIEPEKKENEWEDMMFPSKATEIISREVGQVKKKKKRT